MNRQPIFSHCDCIGNIICICVQGGSSSNSSTEKYVSNMSGQLDGIELIGIIGAVTALVVICIVTATVLVIRRKKKQRYKLELAMADID